MDQRFDHFNSDLYYRTHMVLVIDIMISFGIIQIDYL
jgi:hypothetical protein